MNYRYDLAEIYESNIINEVAGATNYWLSADGELIKVEDHIDYAVKNFNTPFHFDFYKYIPKNLDGSDADQNDVYDSVFQMGYVRVVEDSSNIYFTYLLAKKPNKDQFMALYDLANEKNKNLVDGETDKVIINNNDVEPDMASNEKVKEMDYDMMPSFYKKRGNYGESVSKFALNDYTKLIYENYNYLIQYYQQLLDTNIEVIGKKNINSEYTNYIVHGELLEIKPNGLNILYSKIFPEYAFKNLGEFDDEIFIPFSHIAAAANDPELSMMDIPQSKSGRKKYMKKNNSFADYETNATENSYEKNQRLMNKKFPWIHKMIQNNDIMSNFVYENGTDTLVYSIAFMPDYVKKDKAIEIAKQVFPKLKRGMDFYSFGKKPIIINNIKVYNIANAISDELKSYDVSIDNVQTGYWDLVLNIYKASAEPPNKLIKASDLFYKSVEYLAGEEPENLEESFPNYNLSDYTKLIYENNNNLIDKVNNTQFYRGVRGENSDNLKGPQYFSNVEFFAKTYGPVSPHRINLKNPKFVDNDEWSDYASSPFESSIDIAKKVKNMGYDSVVNIRSIPSGEMITVFVVDGNSTKA